MLIGRNRFSQLFCFQRSKYIYDVHQHRGSRGGRAGRGLGKSTDHCPVDSRNQHRYMVVVYRPAGPAHHLGHGVVALLPQPLLHLTQFGMATARQFTLVSRYQLLPSTKTRCAEQQLHHGLGGGGSATAPVLNQRQAFLNLFQLVGSRMFDGPGDEILQRGEIVRGGGQRQTGSLRHCAVPHRINTVVSQ